MFHTSRFSLSPLSPYFVNGVDLSYTHNTIQHFTLQIHCLINSLTSCVQFSVMVSTVNCFSTEFCRHNVSMANYRAPVSSVGRAPDFRSGDPEFGTRAVHLVIGLDSIWPARCEKRWRWPHWSYCKRHEFPPERWKKYAKTKSLIWPKHRLSKLEVRETKEPELHLTWQGPVRVASWSCGRHLASGSEGPRFESWLWQVDFVSLGKALYMHILTPLMCKTITRL